MTTSGSHVSPGSTEAVQKHSTDQSGIVTPRDAKTLLSALIRRLNIRENKRALTDLGSGLADAIGRDRAYTYQYLHSVLKGHLEGSNELCYAIMLFGILDENAEMIMEQLWTEGIRPPQYSDDLQRAIDILEGLKE